MKKSKKMIVESFSLHSKATITSIIIVPLLLEEGVAFLITLEASH